VPKIEDWINSMPLELFNLPTAFSEGLKTDSSASFGINPKGMNGKES
jgi:hypothetical protein